MQPGLSVFHGEPCAGPEREDPGEKIQVKQEPSVLREEPRVPPPHQASVPEEAVSPAACLEDEQRIAEMLHPQMPDDNVSPLLQAHQCMQIKEETEESKSGLGTEIFCMSQSSAADDPSSAVASSHASGLEMELDGLSSSHNASKVSGISLWFVLMEPLRSLATLSGTSAGTYAVFVGVQLNLKPNLFIECE